MSKSLIDIYIAELCMFVTRSHINNNTQGHNFWHVYSHDNQSKIGYMILPQLSLMAKHTYHVFGQPRQL